MATQWLRLWHDLPNDPKWRTIARVSGQRIGDVISVYIHLLVEASNATERGRTQPNASEHIASALDIEKAQVDEILSAMQGRVLEDGWISGWEKRQPKREDGAAERAQAWREAKAEEERLERERNRTQPNATERPDKDKDKDSSLGVSTNVDTSDLPNKSHIPVQQIVDLYHEVLPMLPQVKKLTKTRRGQIEARWRGKDLPDLQTWRDYFEFCAESKFLMGLSQPTNGHKPFVADLEWLTKEANYAKVYERKYHR